MSAFPSRRIGARRRPHCRLQQQPSKTSVRRSMNVSRLADAHSSAADLQRRGSGLHQLHVSRHIDCPGRQSRQQSRRWGSRLRKAPTIVASRRDNVSINRPDQFARIRPLPLWLVSGSPGTVSAESAGCSGLPGHISSDVRETSGQTKSICPVFPMRAGV